MKSVKIISALLGFSMFTFGILKLMNPFKGWYSIQIINSGLNESLYWPGLIGEIFSGALFLGIVLFNKRFSKKVFSVTIISAAAMVTGLMATAIYVHLQPNVPANVLPLKIKAPFIPCLFLVAAIADIFLLRRIELRNER